MKLLAPCACISTLSLLAFPISYALNHSHVMRDPFALFVAGALICVLFFVASRVVLRNVISGLFTFFAFTTVIDLILALTAAKLSSLGEFYLIGGEPYLATAYGCWALAHDFVTHFPVYLYLGAYHSQRDVIGDCWTQRYTGLFWFGSMMNSMNVLFPAVFSGEMGEHTELSILMNVPFFIFPLWYGVKVLSTERPQQQQQQEQQQQKQQQQQQQQKQQQLQSGSEACASCGGGIFTKLADLICGLWFVFFIVLSFVRLFASFGSRFWPAAWWGKNIEPMLAANTYRMPALQMIVNVYWGVPLQGILAYAHWSSLFSGSTSNKNSKNSAEPTVAAWVSDVSAIVLGMFFQGQTAFLGSSLMQDAYLPSPSFVAPPPAGLMIFWLCNVAAVLVPLLSFWRFRRSDEKVHVK